MKPDNAFGQAVRQHRRSLDLTQEELARRVGCAPVTLRKIEYGDLRPSQQIAERLAMALAIPLDERAEFVRQARAVQPGGRPIESPSLPQVSPDEIGLEDLSGRAIRGYMLGEKIGAGAFGAVYRAVQPLVEREVAIKIILPKHANHPDFIRRFEAEAQLVARLEHPHIVPLYDYWREPGVAYLVMRLLRGGNVQELIDRGPLSLDQIVHLLDQIGSALQAAHRSGVVHRDLKPSNVLLDEDGNAYLADFGIAKNLGSPDAHTQTGMIIGSPAYISPEQINSDPVRPQTDIYSLGVMLYEMLTGAKPFAGPTPILLIQQHLFTPMPPLAANRQGLPAAFDDIIARATAKDQAQRYAEVDTLLADFKAVLHSGRLISEPIEIAATSLREIVNPYKGLRPFEEADAPDFFGREALTQQLLVRLGEGGDLSRFLAIVGPSGSGKSSVVKAGLIPALRRGGLPNSENWFVVELLPGAHPLEELEAALLRIAVNPPPSLLPQMREDKRGLLRAIQRSLPADDQIELVLVLDQFEEVFTLVDDEGERTQLLDGLVEAVLTERSRVRVIVTLRADFIDRPLRYMDFGELVQRRSELVLPLTPDELERAIVGPADRVGLRLEAGLPEAISADVIDQPGALPLLQYALTELFDQRLDRTLTKAAYQAIGGVRGALGRRAEEVYQALDEAGQAATRQVFLRLVTLGEGTEDVRRRVLRSELEAISLQPSLVNRVLDAFGKARLLSFDRDLQTRGPTVEVAHEALLREWPRLREWLNESRADVRLQRVLANETTEWINARRDRSYLLQGARLAQFEGWAAMEPIALTHDERAFLDASVAERHAREAAEADRQQRELEAARQLAETEKQRAEEQTRSAAKLRRRAVYLSGALLIAGVLAIVAVLFGQQANSSAQQAQLNLSSAQSRELAAAAINNLQIDPERSVLLALQGLDQADTLEARNALHQALPELHLLRTIAAHKQTPGVAVSPDGTRLASIGVENVVTVWDATTGQKLLTVSGDPSEMGYGIAFSPDGKQLATLDTAQVVVWDATTGQRLFSLPGKSIGQSINHIRFSPDGQRLAVANMDGVPKVWDLATQTEVISLTGHTAICDGIAYSPDGTRLATGSEDGVVKIWDTNNDEILFTFEPGGVIHSVAFSPDGTRLAAANEDGTLKVWDPITGQEVLSLPRLSGMYGVAFMSDSQRLITAHQDGTARVWDVVSGQPLITLAGHVSTVVGVAAGLGEGRIATAGYDGTVRIWDAVPGRELLTLAAHAAPIWDLAHSPDGAQLATASADGTAKLWNTLSGQPLLTLTHEGLADGLSSLAFSPDGNRLAGGGMNGTVGVWDLDSGQLARSLPGHSALVFDLAFSPDGTRLASTSWDGTARVWDAVAGGAIVTFTGHLQPGQSTPPLVGGVAFSPDGRHIFTGGTDGYVREWDAATGQEVRSFSGEGLEIYGTALSPDGQRLALGRQDGVVTVWDVASGQKLHHLSGHAGLIVRLAFSRDGTRLASASFDKVAKVWDVATGQELATFYGNTSNVFGVAFNPAGTQLATAGGDGTARTFTLQMNDLIQLARARVTRSLTSEECHKYLHLDECPQQP
jgi:WD40 repeat protein/serine/threonine protein kinase/DNA-binding XRE family transcriptional regulator